MKTLLTVLLLMLSMVAKAQTPDTLYEEDKKLYDEKKYALVVKKLLPAGTKMPRPSEN